MWRDLDILAKRQRGGVLHAAELLRRGRGDALLAAERLIGDSDAIHSIVTVKSSTSESARQRCLATLATHLNRLGVTHLVLDNRDIGFGYQLSKQATTKYPKNAIDHTTLQGLIRVGELDPVMTIAHGTDQRVHQLWLPDLVAHAVNRALTYNDPDQLVWITHRLQLLDAHVLPVAQRSKETRIVRDLGLTTRLNQLTTETRHHPITPTHLTDPPSPQPLSRPR
jgi:hypothetical protein